MNFSLGDTEVSLGDVADAGKSASKVAKATSELTKATNLPGAASTGGEAGSAEPEVCPTCNQKVVTTQPGTTVDGAMDKAGNAADTCGKCFDCFGKGLDSVDKIQGMTGQE